MEVDENEMTEDSKSDRERFGELLDVFGPDFERWPAGAREQLAGLPERDGEARLLWREAVALEKLLQGSLAGPQPGAHPVESDEAVAAGAVEGALQAIARRERGIACRDRSVDAAVGTVVPAATSGDAENVVAMTSSSRAKPVSAMRPAGAARRWHAAAVMAASLLAGLYLGLADVAVPSLDGLVTVASTDGAGDDFPFESPLDIEDTLTEGLL